MVRKCPRCGIESDDKSVYCHNCGHGLRPSARTMMLTSACGLLLMASVGSLVFLILSIDALLNTSQWYPAFVAASWFQYDVMFAAFSLLGAASGFAATALVVTRRRYGIAFAATLLCLVSETGLLTTSLIQPFAVLWQSLLYYFLPLFLPSLIAFMTVYYRSAEFK